MGADGEPGGLLVVGEYPTYADDTFKRPMASSSGRMLRSIIKKYWSGPVVYENAIKCSSKGKVSSEISVAACKPYLIQTIKEATPIKILAFGYAAHLSLIGRAPTMPSAQLGVSWLELDGKQIPVFLFPYLVGASINSFHRRDLERDVAFAVSNTPKYFLNATYSVLDTNCDWAAVEKELEDEEWLALDIESAGMMHEPEYTVLCCGVASAKKNKAWVWTQEALKTTRGAEVLQALLDRCTISGANIKFDLRGLLHLGFRLPTKVEDIQLWRKIVQPENLSRLEIMAELVGMGGHKEEMEEELELAKARAKKEFKNIEKNQNQASIPGFEQETLSPPVLRGLQEGWEPRSWAYGHTNPEILRRYNARDAVSTAHLRNYFEPIITGQPWSKLVWEKLLSKAITAAIEIENWGIACDKDSIQAWSHDLALRQKTLASNFKYYGFNPNSNDQVGKYLFEELGLPIIKLTDGGKPSTDEDVLTTLKGRHRVVDDLMLWRSLSKMRGTYADGGEVKVEDGGYVRDFPGKAGILYWVRADGRIHGSLKLAGTRTGRLSMEEPNLQNIPSPETEDGVMARSIFTASPGNVLVQLDYSQQELRVGAMLSGDKNMIDIFRRGVDYHQQTAELISQAAWGIPPGSVTALHRKLAKTVNFSLIYGKSDQGLAQALGVSVDTAVQIRRSVLGAFPDFARWLKKQVQICQETGYSYTVWEGQLARRRPLYDILSQDSYKAGNAKRAASNTPIQGTAADFCLVSICRLIDWIKTKKVPVKVVATVHDSILLDVPPSLMLEAAAKAKSIMTDYDTGNVPLSVDIEYGKTWGSMQDLLAE